MEPQIEGEVDVDLLLNYDDIKLDGKSKEF